MPPALPIRAANIFPGSDLEITTIAFAPLILIAAFLTASAIDFVSKSRDSIRCEIVSESVSEVKTWPLFSRASLISEKFSTIPL